MANGDIIQVLLNATGNITVPIINNFTYQQTVGASASNLNTLITLFKANIMPSLLPVISSSTQFNFIQAKQLTGGTDIVIDALTTANFGTASALFMPPEVCWSFRYFRSTSTSRNGQKRFGLVPSPGVIDGEVGGGFLPTLNALAGSLGSALTDGTYTWEPRILRTRLNGAILPTPEVFSVAAVQYISVGTQNSRKFNKH